MLSRLILSVIITFQVLNSPLALSRIKDIASVEGVRDNILIGYGIVVGLSGTGDNLQNSVFTQKGLVDFLEKVGVNVQGANLNTKNIAAVMVTANLPAFSRQGSKLNVNVSAIGDAKSLKGGTLLATTLLGADGNVYAVAQGPISLKTFDAISSNVKNKDRSVLTSGLIQSGAIVENEIDFALSSMTHIKFSLYNPDFSTALAIADAVNNNVPGNTAQALDPGTVEVTVPNYRKKNVVEFLASIEQLTVETDSRAKIIIDESAGTIVMGENVRINPVSITQGNLVISVSSKVPVQDGDRGKAAHILDDGTSLKELVTGLNKLGIWPRDMINILQNIQAAGAMQAEIDAR
jgi:flagellar P-ring protein precursor FlgI